MEDKDSRFSVGWSRRQVVVWSVAVGSGLRPLSASTSLRECGVTSACL